MARLDSIDLRLLRVLVAVVEGRGFAAAQTQLNVGASTISNHMTALETRLGVKLCQRGRAGFKLTPEGELVYGETQKLFAAMEAFEFKVGALKSSLRASLALGIVDNTITDLSAPIHETIGRFTRQVRDVQLLVECRPPNELLREVLEGRLDGDALFFSRDLAIEGDTAAVVALRNAIDNEELDLVSEAMALLGPLEKLAVAPAQKLASVLSSVSGAPLTRVATGRFE